MARYQTGLAALVAALLFASASFQLASAADEDPLQDVGPALNETVQPNQPNGFARKINDIVAYDFVSDALRQPSSDPNQSKLKAVVTPAAVQQFAGINTQGISGARIDFAPGGLNPPHIHPRASEFFFLIKGGPLEVGFVTTTGNTLFNNTIWEGDVAIFPRGLIHFQKNRSDQPAFAVAALNSQNPGVQQVANAFFNSTINPDILAQALNVGEDLVYKIIEAQFS